ncbi:hypothetical protein GCM10020001_037840 [Nonomuraea salmonea]
MRVTKGAQIVAGTALLALAVAACGGGASDNGGTAAGGAETPVRMEIGEPQELLNPQNTTETEGSEVLAAIFSPLVSYDESKQPVEEAAESVTTEDSKVWTIKLKSGYTWHDGTPVKAADYARAWNYAALQDNAMGSSYFFGRIDGYEDVHPGEGKTPTAKEMKGLKVVDDLTLEVTLTAPFSQFKTMLGYTAFYPMPESAIGSDGKITQEYGEKPIGQGLFKMDKPYKKGTDPTVELSVYDKYPGKKPTGWTKLQFKVYTSSETAWNDLQAENLDIHDSLPATAIATAKSVLGDRYFDEPDAAIGYIGVPLKYNKDFENVDIRKAISMAIDRKTIADTVFSGTRAPPRTTSSTRPSPATARAPARRARTTRPRPRSCTSPRTARRPSSSATTPTVATRSGSRPSPTTCGRTWASRSRRSRSRSSRASWTPWTPRSTRACSVWAGPSTTPRPRTT